uniref:Zinc transporter 1 n=1 Tax=Macrostomum lignano TaxID=282301 RepID=A0A1I8JE65_9PLAT
MFHLKKTHRLVLMILMAVGYFVVELVVGHLCDSMTLVADSFHMLSDVLALTVALGAVRMAKKPRDRRHTYGFQRAEILGTLVNTVMLVTLCFTIIMEAIHKLFEPKPVTQPKLIIGVGAGGLLINLIGILLFCGHSHGHSHGGSGGPVGDVDKLLQYKTVMVMSSMPDDSQQPAETNEPDGNGGAAAAASAAPTAAGGAAGKAGNSAAAANNEASDSRSGENGVGMPLLSDSGTEQHHHSLHQHGNRLRRPSLGPSWLNSPAAAVPVNGDVGGGGPDGHGHGSAHSQTHGGQMNMHAAFLHIIGDTLGSVIVIISALILWLSGYSEMHKEPTAVLVNGTCLIEESPKVWLTYIDPVLSLLLVGIMLVSTVPLLLRALSILMQTVPQEICLDELRDKLEKIDGIIRIHDLHVWQLQSDCYIGTVHIRCRDLPDYITVSKEAKKIFHDFNIHCTTIQPEFSEHADCTDNEVSDSQCIIDCGNQCEARANCCATGAPATAPGAPASAPENSSTTDGVAGKAEQRQLPV